MTINVGFKTLDDIINNSDRYDINKITYFTVTDDQTLVIPDTNLFQIYRRFINPYIYQYNVSIQLRERYRHKPHLLSNDVYGTPELAWLILFLNDQECPSKFRLKQTVKLIPANTLATLYDRIATKSSAKMKENWSTYLNMVE